MDINIKNYISYILICGILCMNSCKRDSEIVTPENAPAGTLIDVDIDLLASGYKEIKDKTDTYAQITKDNVTAAVEVERTVDTDDFKLNNDIRYKVVAYKKDDKKYTFQESNDFIVGDNSKIKLNKSQNYTLIIYSLGNNDAVPDLMEQDDFDKASININPTDEYSSTGLFYQRIDNFIPDGRNDLILKLEPKISRIRLAVDASDFYGGNNPGKILDIKNAKLSYSGYKDAKLKISDTNSELTYDGDETKNLDISNLSDESNKKFSKWIDLFVNTSKNNGNITFSADIAVDGMKTDIPYEINIKNLKPSFKQNINLKLELCGLNTPKGWRQFMCHDLGADYGANPFKGDLKLHGARYQWAGVAYASAEDDMFHEVINSWDKTTIKPDNSEEEARWGGNNPCPDDYRILDSDDLRELAKHKFRKADSWGDIAVNNGFELEDSKDGKLFFPTTGFRDEKGKLDNLSLRDETNLWARREDYSAPEKASVFRISNDANNRVNTNVSKQSKKMGFAVRCIKKSVFDYLGEKK